MSPPTGRASDDLSALAWVHEELRRSLDAAHKALRRYVKETDALGASDLDAIDPAVLRNARAQVHQGVGALELVGQPAAAMVLRASEGLVQRFVARPHKLTLLVVEDIERASFALLDYLGRLLAGKQVSTLSLFPAYRAVQEAAGADRVHPADLWQHDFQWRELPADASAAPRRHDTATQAAIEAELLPLMRGAEPLRVAGRMSELCAGLGAGAEAPAVAGLWQLAAAVFQAQACGLLGFDVFSKRVASRLLAQFRILARGESDVSERLAQDLLFFCAQSAAPADPGAAPRLAAVRAAYGLASQVPVDYTVSVLGRFDPTVVAQAKKRVVAAKDAWSGVAGGEMHRMTGLSEQFALVGESLKKLFPLGEQLAAELQQSIAQTQQSGAAPPAPLAMEVATSLLYVEAALDDVDFDHPDQAERVRRLAERLAGVRRGQPPAPLEGWMEELYRRVSDRQTMGSVVQELRASLSEVEKQIDTFFRHPGDRQVLIPVPNQLQAMRGVLSVLGMDHAAAALLRMRDTVDELAATEVDPAHVGDTGVFDRLAGNLGALGFLIDMLSVQPQMAKSLFTYDEATGALDPVMGRSAGAAPATGPAAAGTGAAGAEQRLIEQAQMLAFSSVREDVPLADVTRDLERLTQEAHAADQPALAAAAVKARVAIEQAADDPAGVAAARGELSETLVDFVASSTDPVGLEPEPAPAAPPPAFAASTRSAQLAQDDEMLEVFLEEAGEVLGDARDAVVALADAPDDLALLTTLRRAFHTLKGSSRMVGLKDFGDGAWACEQLYNAQLAEQAAAPQSLIEFTGWSVDYLGAWVAEIAARSSAPTHDALTVVEAARLAIDAPPAPPLESESVHGALAEPAVSAPTPFAPTQVDAVDIPAAVPALPEVEELSFELDLGALDAPAEAVAQAPVDAGAFALRPSFDEPTQPLPLVADAVVPAPAFDLDFVLDLDEGRAPTATDASAVPLPDFETSEHMTAPFDAMAEPAPMAPVEAAADAPALDVEPAVHAEAPPATETPVPEALPEPLTEPATGPGALDDELVKRVGPLRIGIPLFNIYLNEADELSRRLGVELAEWAMELHRPIGDTPIALAHSLAGSSATVGFADLSHLARLLEHAQARSAAIGHGTPEEAGLFVDAAEEIRRLLHQFAAGFLKEPAPELLQRLAEHELSSARRLEAAAAAAELPPVSGPGEFARAPVEPAADAPWHGADAEAPADPHPAAENPASAPAPASETAALPVANEAAGQHPVEATDLPAPPLEAAAVAPDRLDAPAAPAGDVAPGDPVPSRFDTGVGTFQDSVFGRADPRLEPLGLAELKPLGELPVDSAVRPSSGEHALVDADDAIDAVDAVDAELFPIFEEEAEELLPQLASRLRDWTRKPADPAPPAACMRTLHTLKGGARLAGAMRLGEMAHRLETRIERLLAQPSIEPVEVEALQAYGDTLTQTFDVLRGRAPAPEAAPAPAARPDTSAPLEAFAPSAHALPVLDSGWQAVPDAAPPPVPPVPDSEAAELEPLPDVEAHRAVLDAPQAPAADAAEAGTPATIDWSRFPQVPAIERKAPERAQVSQSAVRVRAPLLDRLVNQAGEVSIARSRIETGVVQIKTALGDLTENLERLRAQLRDIEFHGEVQMTSRLEAAKAASQSFDPLEFDRFTRFQELTRMMAESVNDVATVQRSLQRALETAEDELVAQARMTRELQDDLLRTRMVEFEGLSDRLYRVVRQAAKETGKSVRLDLLGGSIEVDRGVLDRVTGAFEHLLRNCVSHGIEAPEQRAAAGKDPTGTIIVSLTQEGNEVGVEFRDDGAGLDLPRIRAKGIALGLLDPAAEPSDAELANLIFAPGFSTAETVTELSGRGVGMDVVRNEVNAMGGRVETATAAGQGTAFKLILPLTTAVTQVVMLRCGDTQVAVPSTLVEVVRRAAPAEVDAAYAEGGYPMGDRLVPFFWLGALLQVGARPGPSEARTRPVVVIRSAQQRIALHVDEVLGNQEVVVKNLGPQLSRLPGLAGITLLASGTVALIYNPVALATLYGDTAREATRAALQAPAPRAEVPDAARPAEAPLVMVVDDSLTVRRVTQRLLVREGYRVVLAKDGLDALERLAEAVPQLVLSDIEMPRMDGFDLVRNMRADARLRDLPVIMITSRIAQKHRDYAAELGVDHYLGKPYAEDDLLALLARYTRAVPAPA